MKKLVSKHFVFLYTCVFLQACSGDANIIVSSLDSSETGDADVSENLEAQLRQEIVNASNGDGLSWAILPNSDNLQSIPQDTLNPLTYQKIQLGQFLFHDTAIATKGQSGESTTWSCASCHHAAAGFKSGIPQGIGEGGVGFGSDGESRRLATDFDAMAENNASNKPDIQPLASPSILNSAYQDVMLWNGQFGNSSSSAINQGIPNHLLATPDTPKKENLRALSGLETQAIAGLDVHRLAVTDNSVLQTNISYQQMFNAAFPSGSIDVHMDAGKAIAAYERTVLANMAPFQQWLRGSTGALNKAELRGGILFFGKAGCADCHRGPALSSEVGALEDDVFMAIGFNDFDSASQPLVHGEVKAADKQGRGGFTLEAADMYKFKIPQLYNLADTNVFGHGASFSSVREVLEYKNAGIAQNALAAPFLDQRFKPLQLEATEIDDLEQFLTTALYDGDLMRYQPVFVPSGECIIVDPKTVNSHGLCP